jgi:hypothetical protein
MRCQVAFTTVVLALSLEAQVSLQTAKPAAQALPLRNGRPAVAVAGPDPIYLDELLRERGAAADKAALQQGRGSSEDLALVDRLITIRLIAQEASRMGMADAPEIKKQVDVTSREILREVLIDRLVKDVAADPAAVEKLFRDAVREWKTTALIFQDQAAATKAQKELASGAAFADVSARSVAAKTAAIDSDNLYHAKKDYLPQIATALAALQVGQVSPVLRLQAGFVVIKVVDIRYPENADARSEAKRQVLSQQQAAFMKAHEQALRKQYVVVNSALLKGLNYEAPKPTLEALLQDKRVVAEIKGGQSVTVGDLTDYLRLQFFHGSDQAAMKKRMNQKKEDALDATLARRLLNLEALKLGIDKTNEYRDRVAGYRESLVFDAFVQKVIAPENKVTEDEVKQYYNSHLKDYSYPGMLKLKSLAFSRRNAAEDAIMKLRVGTDFNWLAANADGRAPKGTPGLIAFDGGQPVMIDSMPDGMQKALINAKKGEDRLYASPDGIYYVLSVQQVIGSQAKPYGDVREEAAKKLYAEKIQKGLDAYAAKLKTKAKVEVYLARVK